jgi:hypothetical protein
MKSVGMTGEEEDFSFPLFQTFGMFLGMCGGINDYQPHHHPIISS